MIAMLFITIDVLHFQLIRNHAYKEKRLEQWKSYVARTSKYPLLMVNNSPNEIIVLS